MWSPSGAHRAQTQEKRQAADQVCGKTTLLNCRSGLDEFDRGEVLIEGEPISGMSDRKRTRFRAEKMGFIFQTYNLIPILSAVENVELPLLGPARSPKRRADGQCRYWRHSSGAVGR